MTKKKITYIFLGVLILYLLFGRFLKTEVFVFFHNKTSAELKKTVEKTMEGTNGTYGIVIKNLKNEQSYTFNENQTFEAGSLYKLWVLLTAFDQIEKGELKEDEILSQDIAVLNNKFNIASESAEMTEGTITLSVKDAMEQMITISHNFAALLLSEKVKIFQVSKFLGEHGFNNSSVGDPPQTTPSDIALFFQKLYNGELASKENSRRILDLLKRQELNDGLPKYLPQNVGVAHKTGDIGWFKHDAGIIFLAKGDYIIVIMSESASPPGAQERIAEISKAVYEYFK